MPDAMSVVLRPYSITDAADLFDAASSSVPEMHAYMPWCHPGYALEEAQAWVASRGSDWEAGREYDFAIRAGDGRLLGGCGLNQIDLANRRANLGYWVRTDATRRGVATASVGLLADWAFANTALDRLEIVVAVENVASQRVAEKAKAVREGVLRGRVVLHGKSHDAVVYSILRTDRH